MPSTFAQLLFEDLTSPLKQQLSAIRFDAYKRAGLKRALYKFNLDILRENLYTAR